MEGRGALQGLSSVRADFSQQTIPENRTVQMIQNLGDTLRVLCIRHVLHETDMCSSKSNLSTPIYVLFPNRFQYPTTCAPVGNTIFPLNPENIVKVTRVIILAGIRLLKEAGRHSQSR